MDPQALAMAAFAVPATIGVVDKFLPDLHEVRQSAGQATALNVRMGELAVGAWVLGVGAYLAWACQSRHPVIIGGVGLALLIAVYETALRSHVATKGDSNGPA